jgi:hypothetical protein
MKKIFKLALLLTLSVAAWAQYDPSDRSLKFKLEQQDLENVVRAAMLSGALDITCEHGCGVWGLDWVTLRFDPVSMTWDFDDVSNTVSVYMDDAVTLSAMEEGDGVIEWLGGDVDEFTWVLDWVSIEFTPMLSDGPEGLELTLHNLDIDGSVSGLFDGVINWFLSISDTYWEEFALPTGIAISGELGNSYETPTLDFVGTDIVFTFNYAEEFDNTPTLIPTEVVWNDSRPYLSIDSGTNYEHEIQVESNGNWFAVHTFNGGEHQFPMNIDSKYRVYDTVVENYSAYRVAHGLIPEEYNVYNEHDFSVIEQIADQDITLYLMNDITISREYFVRQGDVEIRSSDPGVIREISFQCDASVQTNGGSISIYDIKSTTVSGELCNGTIPWAGSFPNMWNCEFEYFQRAFSVSSGSISYGAISITDCVTPFSLYVQNVGIINGLDISDCEFGMNISGNNCHIANVTCRTDYCPIQLDFVSNLLVSSSELIGDIPSTEYDINIFGNSVEFRDVDFKGVSIVAESGLEDQLTFTNCSFDSETDGPGTDVSYMLSFASANEAFDLLFDNTKAIGVSAVDMEGVSRGTVRFENSTFYGADANSVFTFPSSLAGDFYGELSVQNCLLAEFDIHDAGLHWNNEIRPVVTGSTYYSSNPSHSLHTPSDNNPIWDECIFAIDMDIESVSVTATNCLSTDDSYESPGVIDYVADPLFVDASGSDFRLRWDSPCMDYVEVDDPATYQYDFDLTPRDVGWAPKKEVLVLSGQMPRSTLDFADYLVSEDSEISADMIAAGVCIKVADGVSLTITGGTTLHVGEVGGPRTSIVGATLDASGNPERCSEVDPRFRTVC